MIFSALTLLLASTVALVNVVTTTGGRGRGSRRNDAGTTAGRMASVEGVDPQYLCPKTGLIKSWKGASKEDDDILRQLVVGGLIDRYDVARIKAEYARFNRFTNKCLSDKRSNLARQFRDSIGRRDQMDADQGGGQGLPAYGTYQSPPSARSTSQYYEDDRDDDVYETMSRMTLDEQDDMSFASRSSSATGSALWQVNY